MSQAMTSSDATYGGAGYPDRSMKPAPRRASRSRKQVSARLPMLDSPADLFGENATLPELVTVDFLLQCDAADPVRTSH